MHGLRTALIMALAFRQGYRWRDKITLLGFGFNWLLIGILQKAGLAAVHRRPLLTSDVVLKTPDGLYLCRRLTDDPAVIISPDEESFRNYIRANLSEGLFIDVGAHIGLYTVMAGRQLAERGQVLAIEPDPANFEALVNNIKRNGLTNIRALNAAAWLDEGEALLALPPQGTGSGWSTLLPGHQSNWTPRKMISVKKVSLDALLADSVSISGNVMVKIDAEAAESYILQGMTRLMQQCSNIRIVFEALDTAALESATALLHEYHFQVMRLGSTRYLAARGDVNSK